ncbi:MAG: hypothetical protein V3U71_06995 [Cocleimonas sp.]
MSINFRANMMMTTAIIFAIYSVLWGLAPYDSINLPSGFILDISDWPIDNLSSSLDRNTKWLTSIAAGLLAAISIFLGGIVVPAIKENNKPILRTTVFAMVIWYIIDSVGSIASGVTSNAILNTLYLVLVLAPLMPNKNIKKN